MRVQLRRGTEQEWIDNNPVLWNGEFGFESDTNRFKVGDGFRNWDALPYFIDADGVGAAIAQALQDAVLDGVEGAQGPPGNDGVPGADGASAYEVAVANGFVGTELQWLASLVGADGAQGPPGNDGAPGADGAQGPPGNDGAQGPPGNDGADGLSAYEIAVANGFVGDEASWLASLVGADGADGAQGPPGNDGAPGVDGSDGATGPAGPGLPAGGTTGQMIYKASGTDYDTAWGDAPAGGTGSADGDVQVHTPTTDATPTGGVDGSLRINMPWASASTRGAGYYERGGSAPWKPSWIKQGGSWVQSIPVGSNGATVRFGLPMWGNSQIPSPLSPGWVCHFGSYTGRLLESSQGKDWSTSNDAVPKDPMMASTSLYSDLSGEPRWAGKGAGALGSDHMAFFACHFQASVMPETDTYYGVGCGFGGSGYGVLFLVSHDGRLQIAGVAAGYRTTIVAQTAAGVVTAGRYIVGEKYGRRFTGYVMNGNTQVATVTWIYAIDIGYESLLGVQGLLVATNSNTGRLTQPFMYG